MFDESVPTEPEEPTEGTPEASQDPSTAPTEAAPWADFTNAPAMRPWNEHTGTKLEDILDVIEKIRKLTAPQPDPVEIRIGPYYGLGVKYPYDAGYCPLLLWDL